MKNFILCLTIFSFSTFLYAKFPDRPMYGETESNESCEVSPYYNYIVNGYVVKINKEIVGYVARENASEKNATYRIKEITSHRIKDSYNATTTYGIISRENDIEFIESSNEIRTFIFRTFVNDRFKKDLSNKSDNPEYDEPINAILEFACHKLK